MKKIFISIGDINGIGPELILKTLNKHLRSSENIFTIIGNLNIYKETAEYLEIALPEINIITDLYKEEEYHSEKINFYNIDIPGLELNFGTAEKNAGELSGKAIIEAVKAAKFYNGGIVTAPINKYSLHLGGFNYPGHTEFISELLKDNNFLMILDGEIIRVALVTTHLPLKDVSAELTSEKIFNKGMTLYNSLVQDYGIAEPEIVVCSLNPHASDNGLFGDEEKNIIEPAVKELNSKINKGNFSGPDPSDTVFTKNYVERTNAYLVMYHDQGLIPLKLLTFGSGVNFTAGLSVVRTSPDHGTAYNIAGKGFAETLSFKNALNKADLILKNRMLRRNK